MDDLLQIKISELKTLTKQERIAIIEQIWSNEAENASDEDSINVESEPLEVEEEVTVR